MSEIKKTTKATKATKEATTKKKEVKTSKVDEQSKVEIDESVVESIVEQTLKKVEEKEEVKKEEPKIRERLDENMLVRIASGVKGGLTYNSKDGNTILKFNDYGDEDTIELKELRRMRSSSRKFLQKGWIRVLDKEVVEYLNLERFQEESVEPEDLEELMEMKPDQIVETVKNATANAKRLIYGYAKEKYVSGELTNVHTIKAIEDGLGEILDPNI